MWKFILCFIFYQMYTIPGISESGKQVHKTIYIDPDYKGTFHNGTKNQPFNTFDQLKFSSNSCYLLKAGSEIEVNASIFISGLKNCTISSYGEGKKPLIKYFGNGRLLDIYRSKNFKISLISFDCKEEAVCAIKYGDYCDDVSIDSCDIRGGTWGIRIVANFPDRAVRNVRIRNSKIHDIADDGIYVMRAKDVVISNCTIYKVNQNFFKVGKSEDEASGDGIQFYEVDTFQIIKNKIDRSDTGNKFSLILQNARAGRVSGNYFIGPSNNTVIYISYHSSNILIDMNRLQGGKTAVYCHGQNIYLIKNIINEMDFRAFVFIDCLDIFMYHNTCYRIKHAIYGSNFHASVYNNIFYFLTGEGLAFSAGDHIESGNNCYFPHQVNMFGEYSSLLLYRLNTQNGRSSFVSDPLLLDPDNGNFHLNENSPCRKRAKKIHLPEHILTRVNLNDNIGAR